MNKSAAKERILVVDDEPSVRALLKEKLTTQGFACRTSSSGEEALKLLEHATFDVILSDLRMPGISGLALLERASKKHPHSAFLMLTVESDVRVAVKAMQQGADDYLLKPFHLDSVVHSVRRALEKKRLEVEIENYRQHLERMVDQRTKQLRRAMKRIEDTYDSTLEALAAALDLRDAGTAGHSGRVTRYCLEIAKAMGCSAEQLKQIVRGAALHDIGKLGIPDGILLKKEKLNDEERAVMETHPRIGWRLVRRIAFLAPAAEIVLTHQERYDGRGYPQGLVGEQIPLGARIFAVADALDAITSDRPYRRARSFAAARGEIGRESGRQFDPEVVRRFLSLSELLWESISLEAV